MTLPALPGRLDGAAVMPMSSSGGGEVARRASASSATPTFRSAGIDAHIDTAAHTHSLR